jgi:hypothetical protein
MGDAKRSGEEQMCVWPVGEAFRGTIDLHALPPVASINGERIRELYGDDTIPANARVILNAFRAGVGNQTFHAGFCLGDGEKFSAIGLAVVERLSMQAPDAALYVVLVEHEDIAWDMVLRHLTTFAGQVLLFVFPNSDVYDAGLAETHYSKGIRKFDPDGKQFDQLTEAQRREIRTRKAEVLNRPPPPKFYPTGGVTQEDAPWIFRVATPAGKVIRTAVWNGRRNYAHELPTDIARWVGGEKVAIVQVSSPVSVNRRSSLNLTHNLAKKYDGIIHWAKDTETFQSILQSFVRLDLESVSPPDLPDDWDPEIIVFGANG